MKYLLLTLFSFLICLPVWSTEQMPDVLEGKEVSTEVVTHWSYLSPLEHYFHQKAIKSPFEMMHTANYRGHVAHWSVKGKKLFLSKIMVEPKNAGFNAELVQYDLSKLFKVKTPQNDIAATWFSGALLFAVGPHRVNLEGNYYKIAYQSYEILWLKEGVVTEKVVLLPEDYWQGVNEVYSEKAGTKRTKTGELISRYYRSQITSNK